jgi:hypothetical protein
MVRRWLLPSGLYLAEHYNDLMGKLWETKIDSADC